MSWRAVCHSIWWQEFTTPDLPQACTLFMGWSFLWVLPYIDIRVYTNINICLVESVALAPAVVQKLIETILRGIPNVFSFLDDMLVTGKDGTEHLTNLKAVSNWAQQYSLRIQLPRWRNIQLPVEYVVDGKYLHATPRKDKALIEASYSTRFNWITSISCLLDYLSKFVLNLCHHFRPLNDLLKKGQKWDWASACVELSRKRNQP